MAHSGQNFDFEVAGYDASGHFAEKSNTSYHQIIPQVTFHMVRTFYYMTGTSLRVLSFLGY